MIEKLKEIGAVLRKETTDKEELSDILKVYKDLLENVSLPDFATLGSEENIKQINGEALSSIGAANCIDDHFRTKMFVRGLFQAVEDMMAKKDGKIHVVYAGTGPYATLLLPVLASFSSERIKSTLIEINEVSMQNLKQVMDALELGDYVENFLLDNAVRLRLDSPEDVDIVITETMQQALEREQQVPITLNLLKQLREDAVFIPQRIRVDAALMDLSKTEEEREIEHLETIVDLSRSGIASDEKNIEVWGDWTFFPVHSIEVKETVMERLQHLVLTTEINTYGDNFIRSYESGLTTPKFLADFAAEDFRDREVHLQYRADRKPGVVYQMD